MNRQRSVIVSAILIVLFFMAGVFVYEKMQTQRLTQWAKQANSVFKRPHSPTYGPETARVRIIEFFDPACETCRSLYPMVKQLVDSNGGKVQLVIRYAPLHEGSDTAVQILEAARLQGLFWPVLEAMLKGQPVWAAHERPRPDLIWEFLPATGLNVRDAQSELRTSIVLANIAQDIADAKELNVTRTPGFFVNGKPLHDFGYEQLKALVGVEVRASYP